MDNALSVNATTREALSLCRRNAGLLAAWLPLAAVLTFFLAGAGVMFAAVALSHVLGKRATGAQADLAAGFAAGVRRLGPVLICSLLVAACVITGMWLVTLPAIGFLAARLIVLPAVLALENGSTSDALRRASALTRRRPGASIRLAAVLLLPLLLAWVTLIISIVVAVAAIAFTESPDDVRATWIAGFAWAGAALAFLLLWLPVVVAAQTVAYLTLSSIGDEASPS